MRVLNYRASLYTVLVSSIFLVSCSGTPEKKASDAPAEVAAVQKTPVPEPVVEAPAEKGPESAPRPSRPRVTPAARPAAQKPVVTVPQAPPPAPVAPEPQPVQVVPNAPVVLPPPPPAAPPEPVIRKVTIPAGTLINVTMIDSISSDSDHVGQAFKASLASPVILDRETVIPRGADVFVKLVDVKTAGNMTGKSELKVALDRIFLGRKSYLVESNTYVQTGVSQTKQTAKTVGIGTAIGAAIGAISGGKKGAAIGAGVGAGSGAAIEAATKGQQVRIDSESPLTFRLEAPIEVTLNP